MALLTYTGRYRITSIPYHLIKPHRMDIAEWQTACFGTGLVRYDHRPGSNQVLPLHSQEDCLHLNLGLTMFAEVTRSFPGQSDHRTSTVCQTCGRMIRDYATDEDKHSLSVIGSL
jgi:hypothetical protein